MTSATKKAKGRTLAEFWPLLPAELILLSACEAGDIAVLGNTRPTKASQETEIRAAFLRFLALGGDEKTPIHEHGIQLQAAWIEDKLHFGDAVISFPLELDHCYFAAGIGLNDAVLSSVLSLCSSYITKKEKKYTYSLSLDRAVIKGDVVFKGNHSKGYYWLVGAQISGDINCSKAILNNIGDYVFLADSAIIKGDVFFSTTTTQGEVSIQNAEINGNLDYSDATLENTGGDALIIDRTVVKGALFLLLSQPLERASFESANVGQLVDTLNSWGDNIVLDGFTYGSFASVAPTNAKTRIAWLDKQNPKFCGLQKNSHQKFRPQPWQQLQKVLREMGHTEDARQVAIAFENRLRKANLIGQAPEDWNKFRAFIYRYLSRGFHFLFRVLIGYGYRPIRLVIWMIGVWLFCASLFWYSALQGVMAPSNPLIFQNPAYAACVPDSAEAKVEIEKLKFNLIGIKNGLQITQDEIAIPGAGNWYLCAKLREEYTGLSPLAYSLDLILPLVNLQQDSDWAPLIPTPESSRWSEYTNITLKHITRFFVWFEILFGWLASLLMVAVVSGLTKRRED